MSRHNRRRTRGGHKISASSLQDPFELPSLPPDPPERWLLLPRHPRHNDLSARHWHNRYLAWQARERRQKEEVERSQEERKRIFGGEGGDDGGDTDELCAKMMDYFAGLDYLQG